MTYKILLTDDESLLRRVGKAMLTQLGHSVVDTSDGLSAIDILENDSSFNLLMTDLMMPEGISGEQLAEAALKINPNLKIIFLSGYTESESESIGTGNRDIHFLAKPFTLDQLKDAIATRFSEG